MADISQELATIRTGIYGKDIRSSIADAIELVNLDGGGGSGGIVTVANFAAYAALSDGVKYSNIPVAIQDLGMIIINRYIYASPIEVASLSDFMAIGSQIAEENVTGSQGGLNNMNCIIGFIRDNGLGQSCIYANGTYYTPPDLSAYKPTAKLTQAQYDALVDAGTVNTNTVYAITEEVT